MKYQFCAAGTGKATASQRSVEKVRELSGSKKHEFRHSPRGTSCQITKVGYRLPVLHPARRQLQRRHRSDKQQQQLSLSSCPLWQRDHPTQYITRCVYIHCSGISLLPYCCVTVNHLFTVAYTDYRLPIIIRRLPPQKALSLMGTLHRPYRCGALLAMTARVASDHSSYELT